MNGRRWPRQNVKRSLLGTALSHQALSVGVRLVRQSLCDVGRTAERQSSERSALNAPVGCETSSSLQPQIGHGQLGRLSLLKRGKTTQFQRIIKT